MWAVNITSAGSHNLSTESYTYFNTKSWILIETGVHPTEENHRAED